jgi:hypothetical protein
MINSMLYLYKLELYYNSYKSLKNILIITFQGGDKGAETINFTSVSSYIFGIFIHEFSSKIPIQNTGAILSIYGLTNETMAFNVTPGNQIYRA